MTKIEITVSPRGTMRVEAFGFTGGACKVAMQPAVTSLLGDTPQHTENKAEFYQSPQNIQVPIHVALPE
jgi:hypothetical protein